MAVNRIDLLGVPVDILSKTDFESVISELVNKEGPQQIVCLSVWGLLKARGRNTFAECVRNADLVLPISKSIVKGAQFLGLATPVRWNPFSTVIDIMTILENRHKSIYLLGGHKKTLMAAERNVHRTFPSLQVVGRYVGYYPKAEDARVMEAIRKSSPALVLMSEGVRDKDCWFYERKSSFKTSLFCFYDDAVGIFSERRSHVSTATFERGHEIWGELFRNPLKIFLLFSYIRYKILLIWYRLF